MNAVIDIVPDTLNLKSKGNFVTCYIELPGLNNPNVNDIQAIEIFKINSYYLSESFIPIGPTEINDYNNNGLPDLMVKFDRQNLSNVLSEGPAEIWINCEDSGGQKYTGADTVLVIDKGD